MPQILPGPWGMSQFRFALMLKMVVIPSQCGVSLDSCVSLPIHTYNSQTDPGLCDTVRENQNNCFILLSAHLRHYLYSLHICHYKLISRYLIKMAPPVPTHPIANSLS